VSGLECFARFKSALRGKDEPDGIATEDISPHNLWHNPILSAKDWWWDWIMRCWVEVLASCSG
jgi:hypothetical protein